MKISRANQGEHCFDNFSIALEEKKTPAKKKVTSLVGIDKKMTQIFVGLLSRLISLVKELIFQGYRDMPHSPILSKEGVHP